jgi:hypothetical protein
MKLRSLIWKSSPYFDQNHRINRRTTITAVFTVVLLTTFVAQIWFSADALPIVGSLVIQVGNDAVVKDSAMQLSQEIDNAKRFQVNSLVELSLICRKATGQLFYVGHGSEKGLKIGVNIVSWNNIKTVIERTPAKEHYFAACFSSNIGEVEDKMVLGFPSIIDADVASLLISMTYQYIHGYFDRLQQSMQRFFTSDYLSKLVKPQKPLWVVTSELIPRWTPYGLYRPPAVKILLNQADYCYIVAYGTLGIGLTATIIGLCTGGIGAIIGPFLMGIVISIVLIWATDKQGTQPYQYIEIWIPQDPINLAAMLFLKYFWFRTTTCWWHSFINIATPICPA